MKELKDKWGIYWTDEELSKLENTYGNLSKRYALKTATHVEYLKHMCTLIVKCEKEMMNGRINEAREYMELFKSCTEVMPLQPFAQV